APSGGAARGSSENTSRDGSSGSPAQARPLASTKPASGNRCAASAAPPAPARHDRRRSTPTPQPPSTAPQPTRATHAGSPGPRPRAGSHDLLGRHPLRLGHRGDSPLVVLLAEPTSLSATVARPS